MTQLPLMDRFVVTEQICGDGIFEEGVSDGFESFEIQSVIGIGHGEGLKDLAGTRTQETVESWFTVKTKIGPTQCLFLSSGSLAFSLKLRPRFEFKSVRGRPWAWNQFHRSFQWSQFSKHCFILRVWDWNSLLRRRAGLPRGTGWKL